MSDWARFGVSFKADSNALEQITAPLEYGDSRSERIRGLTRDGLAVERGFRNAAVDPDELFNDKSERENWIARVIRDAVREEFGDSATGSGSLPDGGAINSMS